MRFTCDSCQAQYSISDDRVGDRILRVRCKRCGSVILLKAPEAVEHEDPPAAVSTDDATRVLRQDEVRRAIEQASVGKRTASVSDAKEWFFLDAGEQLGPFTVAVLREKAKAGRLQPRTYVWREGMPDWLRLETLPELRTLIEEPVAVAEPPDLSSEDFHEERTEIGVLALFDDEPPEEASTDAPERPTAAPLKKDDAWADELADGLAGDVGDLGRRLLGADAPVDFAKSPKPDPFANVPDAEGFVEAAPGETTNAVIQASGARERKTGRLVAGVLVGVVVVGLLVWFGGQSGVFVPPEPPPRKEPLAPTVDWTKVEAMDDSALGVLSGEAKKKEEDARRRAAAQRRDAEELAGLIPQDVDDRGAIKRANNDAPAVGLSLQQQADLARLREERASGGGPGGARPRQFVETGFDVRSASSDGPDGKGVARKVAEAQPAIGNCVGHALRRNPSQKLGKVTVVATVGASGIVTRAEFRDDRSGVATGELGECVRRVIKGIVFPAFDGDAVDLEIPLVLSGG